MMRHGLIGHSAHLGLRISGAETARTSDVDIPQFKRQSEDRPDEPREALGDAMERGPQWRAHVAATLERVNETAARLGAL